MSLLFECIQTSIVGGMLNGVEGEALARTCVEKLKDFLEDVDQNRELQVFLFAHLTDYVNSTIHCSRCARQDSANTSSSRCDAP
jgi:hypothetical protein